MPSVPADEMTSHLNFLVSKSKIQLVEHASHPGVPFFRLVKEGEVATESMGLSTEQKLLYNIIAAADREGIWTKTLSQKAGLNRIQFPKVIKSLEQRKLIKPFKSITNKIKVFYILYNLEPADRHVGGIWYDSNGDFDYYFFEILRKQCTLFIKEKGYATLQDIQTHIQNSGTSKVEVREEDCKKLLNTLIYDGKVEVFKIDKEEVGYKKIRHKLTNGLTVVPCGVCPVFSSCGVVAEISPQKCDYMKKWLEW
uniref:DNA-directed RNA polymerase III subunit RPC6 n=1 Tax=Arcella intermedia TaxID=1963864 RepID=A0A6B2LDP5_9EUKA